MQRYRRYLAAIAAMLAAFVAAPAMAQGYTFTATVNSPPALGVVVPAASGQTVFRFTPTGTVTTFSGTGLRRTVGAVQGSVTISCASSGNQCSGKTAYIRIGSTGTGTGKAGLLTNFTISSISGGTGYSLISSTANQINFSVVHTNKTTDTTFTFGADFPVSDSSTGTVGAGTSPFYVWVGSSSPPSGGASSAATVTTYRPIGISVAPAVTSPMNFGTIARPAFTALGGVNSSTITMSPSTGVVSATGLALTRGSPTRPTYTITGEGGMAITVTPPPSFVLTNQSDGSKTLTVTLTPTTLPTLLSNAPGAQGQATFSMGGSFVVDSNTALGVYSGSYDITVAYN